KPSITASTKVIASAYNKFIFQFPATIFFLIEFLFTLRNIVIFNEREMEDFNNCYKKDVKKIIN
ncbi:MAG TPA: hypothetical protein PKL85_13165, partial [Bacteroidia bacterium]|nr:hypothetical protein [Bacteroidia bacterium]